eukprot:2519636-Prymnesium_polylepis.1
MLVVRTDEPAPDGPTSKGSDVARHRYAAPHDAAPAHPPAYHGDEDGVDRVYECSPLLRLRNQHLHRRLNQLVHHQLGRRL